MSGEAYAYFPGCTLKNKALELDSYARSSAEALGFSIDEIDEWQCCGGTYPLAKDEIATKLSSIRALSDAHAAGRDLVTLCSACYNVIKQVNNDIRTDESFAAKVNAYLAPDGISYHGEAEVVHFLEVLRDKIGWANVKAAAKKSAPITAASSSGRQMRCNSTIRKIRKYWKILLKQSGERRSSIRFGMNAAAPTRFLKIRKFPKSGRRRY